MRDAERPGSPVLHSVTEGATLRPRIGTELVGKQRILIVDDERNMRTTLADILLEEGYEVRTAESGEKAIKICRQASFDTVLMDVRMPGIDGIEAFRRIRKIQSEVRVIMMSAYSVEHLVEETIREGAVAFLRKPLDAERLLALLGDA